MCWYMNESSLFEMKVFRLLPNQRLVTKGTRDALLVSGNADERNPALRISKSET